MFSRHSFERAYPFDVSKLGEKLGSDERRTVLGGSHPFDMSKLGERRGIDERRTVLGGSHPSLTSEKTLQPG